MERDISRLRPPRCGLLPPQSRVGEGLRETETWAWWRGSGEGKVMERSIEDSRTMRDGRAEKLSVHIADASIDVPGVQSEVEQAEADMRLKMAAREQALRQQWVEREGTLRLEMAEPELTLDVD